MSWAVALVRCAKLRLARDVVDDDRRLEIAEFGRAAIAVGDEFAPFGIVEFLGGLAALPQIATAAGMSVFVIDIVFAQQARQRLIFRRRAAKQFGGLGGIHIGGQLELDDGGNHATLPAGGVV